ncbi:MAG TPA: TonB-dependent receptor [Burkholderiaceae bacterium]|nr:TonB-dependent receptor [Burkholderiaceae bacterium]
MAEKSNGSASRVASTVRLGACAVALGGSPAFAQEVGSQAPRASDVEARQQFAPTVIEGHYDTSIGSTDAASQGTVNGALLQDIPLLRPGEALETVPGLVVTQHSGDGKANQYFLRGYNLDHGTDLSTSVDGVPVNMPTNAHGQGYADLNFLIPELVDHIDYRKGTYFAEKGDFSAAGSTDIYYRSRLDRNFADLTAGSFGYQRMVAAGSMPVGGSGPVLLGAAEVEHTDGPWTLAENLLKTNALLRLGDGGREAGWSVDAAHYTAHWNSTDQVPLELIESGQLGRFAALDPTDGGTTGRDILSGEWHRTRADGYTRASAYAEHYRLRLWSDFTFYELRNGAAPNTNLPSDQFEQVENRNILGGQLVQGWRHGLFGAESATEAGLQVRHDQITVGLLDTQSRTPFATVTDDHVGETETGVYLKNATDWNPWLRSVLGARVDNVAMDVSARVYPQNSGTASATKFSPKASMIFGPWAKTEFFLSAGRGFHSNDARGVLERVDPTTGDPATPVPALVSAFGKEIGVRTETIPGLQSSLAIWSLDSDSEIVYDSDSDIGSTSPNGASKRYGVEWNNHYTAARWLLLDADIAWTHARYADLNANGAPGNRIPNAIPTVARFVATLQDWGPWSGAIEARYFSPYPLSQDGSLTAPSTLVTNLRLRRDLTANATVTLDVLNLFNRAYDDIAYEQDYQVSPTSPVVPSGVTVHPGEPRELRLTLRIRF